MLWATTVIDSLTNGALTQKVKFIKPAADLERIDTVLCSIAVTI